MSAPGRHYRVVKRLPWIEGGSFVPGLGWEGGQYVVYEPGDTVYVDDGELASIHHYLEALDDAGRALLEEVRAKAEAPARRIAVADLRAAVASDDVPRGGGTTDSPPPEGRIELTYAVHHDGTETLLSTRIHPADRIPRVVYDDKGLPAPYTTAIRNRRLTLEQLDTDLQLSRKKGGHASKNLPGLQAAVDRLAAEHPAATAKELWNLVPEVEGDTIEGFIIYRDGSKVVQVEDKTGREKALSFRSFCRYVTAARKKVPRGAARRK